MAASAAKDIMSYLATENTTEIMQTIAEWESKYYSEWLANAFATPHLKMPEGLMEDIKQTIEQVTLGSIGMMGLEELVTQTLSQVSRAAGVKKAPGTTF